MTFRTSTSLSIFLLGFGLIQQAAAAPPFSGTIFLDPDIITPSDPTTFQQLTEIGRGDRWMFDRRVNDWVYLNAFLIQASYDDGLQIEIQVNPEFGTAAAALVQAERFAPIIGRLPTCLREDVQTVWIHQGVNPFGGGNNNLLIHTGQADQYVSSGILEETLVHEASHTSLDADHASSSGWLAAQSSDPEFISTYARDNPTREDVAESFLLYLALRHRADRISQSLADTITQTIPNRVAYFDDQEFNMSPLVIPEPPLVKTFTYKRDTGSWNMTWDSRSGIPYAIDTSSNLIDWVELIPNVPSQGTSTSVSQTDSKPEEPAFFRVRERVSQ